MAPTRMALTMYKVGTEMGMAQKKLPFDFSNHLAVYPLNVDEARWCQKRLRIAEEEVGCIESSLS